MLRCFVVDGFCSWIGHTGGRIAGLGSEFGIHFVNSPLDPTSHLRGQLHRNGIDTAEFSCVVMNLTFLFCLL